MLIHIMRLLKCNALSGNALHGLGFILAIPYTHYRVDYAIALHIYVMLSNRAPPRPCARPRARQAIFGRIISGLHPTHYVASPA